MEKRITSIAKNTSYFTLALAFQKILSFSYFFILAAFFGKEDLGKYYTAISFTTILAMVLDFGLANVITREVAKDKDGAQKVLSSTLSIKLVLAIASLAIGFAVAELIGYEKDIMLLISISSISMVADALSSTIFSAIRGFHNLKFESISAIMFQTVVFVLGLVAMEKGMGVPLVLSALAIGSLINVVYASIVARNKFNLALSLEFSKQELKKLLYLALPFAIFVFAQRSYTYLDSILLSRLAGYSQVGIYQLAFKLVVAMQFMPAAFIASLYPAMSAYWLSNRRQLAISFERAINYLTIISLPVAFGVYALSDKILPLIGSGYQEALWPMRISVAALFFIFINFPIGALLNACDRQKANTRNMIIVAVASVIMNIIIIPRYGALGASITVLLTSILMVILGLTYVFKIIEYRPKANVPSFLKALFSSFLMAILVYSLKETMNPIPVAILAAVLYFVLIFVSGGIKKEDIRSIRASFSRK